MAVFQRIQQELPKKKSLQLFLKISFCPYPLNADPFHQAERELKQKITKNLIFNYLIALISLPVVIRNNRNVNNFVHT